MTKSSKNNQTKPQAGSLAEAEKNIQFWNDYVILTVEIHLEQSNREKELAAQSNIKTGLEKLAIGIIGMDTYQRRTVQVGLGRSLDEELNRTVKKKVEAP
ncbi:uncharacterized protein FIESC28_03287 [Fusarium coffeatum]|uniref:Uncharacterized protein n=1 Tax=Fusarium coffeatum TaxID=231269 RepID=A0A366S3T6_9HYPO|nr:uncharacterized protein FIESC28_03287 [Fusarium coffeatum]RBR23977.1 hypothetical protein FIESC28_03287 [Fusarium coffeatum]